MNWKRFAAVIAGIALIGLGGSALAQQDPGPEAYNKAQYVWAEANDGPGASSA